MTHDACALATAASTGRLGGPSICALMTCFNRRAKTLACLNALDVAAAHAQARIHAVVLDDASTDGTAEAVRARYAWAEVEAGDGSLFWCRGMARAMSIGMQQQHDFYLWLNDDTLLRPDAISRLLECERSLRQLHGHACIVVGSTVDDVTQVFSYGGTRRASFWLPMRFVPVPPTGEPQRCDAMNGNIVLMSAEVARRVGPLDPRFEHAMGDTDYSLRARRKGVGVWVAPGVHGSCSDNPRQDTFLDRSLPLRQRWRRMMGRKGLPWRSWLVLTRRHAGLLWPLHFAWPYVRVLAEGVLTSMRSPRERSVHR